MKSRHLIIGTIAVTAIVIAGLHIFANPRRDISQTASISIGSAPLDIGSPDAQQISANPAPENQNSPGPNSELDTIYTNSSFGISFAYPHSLKISTDSNGEGNVIIVHNDSSTAGFQIYITPYRDADENITKEKLLQNIPDLVIRDEQSFAVGAGSKGLAFMSKTYGIDVREIWFAARGNLYQITAPASSDDLARNVLRTWQFK